MRDEDIFAFGTPGSPPSPPTAPGRRQARRRVWPWLLLAVVVALVLAALCVLLVLALASSPLWAAIFLLWLLLRPRRKAGLASTAPGAA